MLDKLQLVAEEEVRESSCVSDRSPTEIKESSNSCDDNSDKDMPPFEALPWLLHPSCALDTDMRTMWG